MKRSVLRSLVFVAWAPAACSVPAVGPAEGRDGAAASVPISFPDAGLTVPVTSNPVPTGPPPLPGSGELAGPGVMPGDAAKLNGNADPARAPTVVYPLPGSLIPGNLAPLQLQLKRAVASQRLARVTFRVEGFQFVYQARCETLELDPLGCGISLPAEVTARIAQASEVGPLATVVRLAGEDGGDVGEAPLADVSWTMAKLSGGIYYWTSVPDPTDPSNAFKNRTMIRRYDFAGGTGKPEDYWRSNPDSPTITKHSDYERPTPAAVYTQPHGCVGCHAISADGKKLAVTFEGSLASAFAMADVATKKILVARTTNPDGFATQTTFAPAGTRIIQAFRGKLLLRDGETLADIATLFPEVTEAQAEPFWSPTGQLVAFTSFLPGPGVITADLVNSAQIWVAPSDGGGITGPARLLVPRAAGQSNHYPVISSDGTMVAFNRSTCGGPRTKNGWGDDPCDGYNDPSARLMLVPTAGGAPVDLGRANGAESWTNSWPRFSPDRGSFRGQPIHWIAFSSRRPYGLRLRGSTDDSAKPQLWIAAVRAGGQGDPSFAPVWLPNQNDDMRAPVGNHVPQWVVKVVRIE